MFRLLLVILCWALLLWRQVGSNLVQKHKYLTEEHLEMVADKISYTACKELFKNLLKASGSVLRSHEAYLKQVYVRPTCLNMLNHWSVMEGDDATVQALTKQLHLMNQDQLADKIMNSVYEAQTRSLSTDFLFEERAVKDRVSILAQEAPHYHRQWLINESEGTIIAYRPMEILIFSMIFLVTAASFGFSMIMIIPMIFPATRMYASRHFRDFGLL